MKILKINLRKMYAFRGIALALITSTVVASLTSCNSKQKCSIKDTHVHLHTTKEGYKTYLDNEYKTYEVILGMMIIKLFLMKMRFYTRDYMIII